MLVRDCREISRRRRRERRRFREVKRRGWRERRILGRCSGHIGPPLSFALIPPALAWGLSVPSFAAWIRAGPFAKVGIAFAVTAFPQPIRLLFLLLRFLIVRIRSVRSFPPFAGVVVLVVPTIAFVSEVHAHCMAALQDTQQEKHDSLHGSSTKNKHLHLPTSQL
jgi:hypothetical protein